MKQLVVALMLICTAFAAKADDPTLIVERVETAFTGGTTYRVYIQLTEEDQTVHAVFGDQTTPIEITSTEALFQHELGGNLSMNQEEFLISQYPELAFDSFVTIGFNNQAEDIWDVGADFSSFNDNSTLTIENGAWFLLPDSDSAFGDQTNKVMLLQLTTEGTVSGTLNVQGWDAGQETWQRRNLSFSTDQAQVFGCTDPTANNFNPEATYDNGNCDFSVGIDELATPEMFGVYPNPATDNWMNIQLGENIQEGRAVVYLYDQTGKVVLTRQIQAIPGSTYQVNAEVAVGVYTLQVNLGEESQQLRWIKQ